jgi:arylsulfatase A-like enzyme
MMATEKPNILLIMADDIGWFDVGAYHRGLMGTAGLQLAENGRRRAARQSA